MGRPSLTLTLCPCLASLTAPALSSPSSFLWLLVSHLSLLHLNACFSQPQFPGTLPSLLCLSPPSAHPSRAPLHSVSSQPAPSLSPFLPLTPSLSSAPLILSPFLLDLGLFPFRLSLPTSPSLPFYSASFWLLLCDLHSSFLSCSFHRNLQQGGRG